VPAAAAGPAELFSQKDARWGSAVYAKADNPVDECGTTIGQCGCAMTSATNVLRLFGQLTMPDGQPVTPKAVNDFFNQGAKRVGGTWVSLGYFNNNVDWFAINTLSMEIEKAHPGARRIEFVPTWGNGSVEEMKNELRQGRPVILQLFLRSPRYTGPHFVMASGLDGERVVVKDPSYQESRYLDGYLPYIQNSRLFRLADASQPQRGIAVTMSSKDRIRVVDSQGRVVGTFEGNSPEEAVARAKRDLPGAVLTYQPAWRDATCQKQSSAADDGVFQVYIPGGDDTYRIETEDKDGGGCAVLVTRFEADGTITREVIENPDCKGLNYPPRAETPAAGPTTPPTEIPTPTPRAGVTPPTSTPTPRPTPVPPTATPTDTPLPPTATPTRGPQPPTAVSIVPPCSARATPVPNAVSPTWRVAITCNAQVLGTFTSSSWSLNGVVIARNALLLDVTVTRNSLDPLTLEFEACNQTACLSTDARVQPRE
jgi:hypothetical protein